MAALLVHVVIGILPVLAFLGALVALDSYKLVTLRVVVGVVAAGLVVAIACYFANGYLAGVTRLDFASYSRYVGPAVEEFGKAIVVVALIRAHRVGFLVDAAILGFAAGTGFAIVENVYYQSLVPNASAGTSTRSRSASAIIAKIAVHPPCMIAVPKPRTIHVPTLASGTSDW